MNQHKHTEDLQQGRAWLDRAASLLAALQEKLDQQQPWPQDAALEFTRCAATVGAGFVALAHAERAAASADEVSQVRQAILELSDPPLTLGEQCERHPDSESCAVCTPVAFNADGRQERAAVEARPHDDEPTPLPFLGFTTHGHAVGGPVPAGLPKRSVARCGGPAICGRCGLDAARLRQEADRG